jgi:hypothetical protein
MMVGLAGIFAKPALQILDKLGITGNKTEEKGGATEDPIVSLNSKMDTLLNKFNSDSEWVKAIVLAINTGAVKTGKTAGRESTKALQSATI